MKTFVGLEVSNHKYNKIRSENSTSEMEDLNKLERVLRRLFPDEEIDSLARLLSMASKRGEISYEEIETREETKEDLLLLVYNKRLLLPTEASRVSKTLAWEDRLLILSPGKMYEMPNVIRYLIKDAEETGEWRPDHAVRKYLQAIGEPEAEKILKLFQEVRKKVLNSKTLLKTNKITPKLIEECSEKLGLELNIDKAIAELKGGGIISPCPRSFLRCGIRYEINPSLLLG
ncbi:MAG: hypothetical protein ACTSUS_00845 [Candidatus Freyarchaeota archaeon]